MSFFTDFVIADPTSAEKIARVVDAEGTPLGLWEGFSVKSISDLDLATLYGLVQGRSLGEGVLDLLDEFTHLQAGEELSVQLVPPGFVDLLAALPEDRLLPLAETWSAAEEFAGLTDPADLKELIAQLSELARQARGEGRSVLVCISGV